MLVLSALLPGGLYRAALVYQLLGYGLGLLGMWRPLAARVRLASAAASFLVLNGAAWLAFWVWISGRADRSWRKVAYELEPAADAVWAARPAPRTVSAGTLE
jgi:hypothetical protein